MKRPAPKTLQIGFIIGGLLFSVLFLAFTLDIDRDGLIPDETRLAELRSEEKKQSAELKELLNRDAAFREIFVDAQKTIPSSNLLPYNSIDFFGKNQPTVALSSSTLPQVAVECQNSSSTKRKTRLYIL